MSIPYYLAYKPSKIVELAHNIAHGGTSNVDLNGENLNTFKVLLLCHLS